MRINYIKKVYIFFCLSYFYIVFVFFIFISSSIQSNAAPTRLSVQVDSDERHTSTTMVSPPSPGVRVNSGSGVAQPNHLDWCGDTLDESVKGSFRSCR